MNMRSFIRLVENIGADYTGFGPLYHGTNVIRAGSILLDGRVRSGDDAVGENAGLSLTTSFAAARDFASDRSVGMLDDDVDERFRGAVLVFDPTRLRDEYRLHHYVDGGNDDESEVRVITTDGIDLTALVAIHADPNEIEWIARYLTVNGDRFREGPRLLRLKASPLLRPFPNQTT